MSKVPTLQICPGALRPEGPPLTDKFPNALTQPLLRTSSMDTFPQKPHHNLRDSFLHSLSNPSPCTKSAFLGCLSCVALCCLLSKLIILSLLFAFDIFLQPSQKKLTCYCTLIIYTFFHVYFLLATYGDIVLVFIVIVRPSVVSLYKCLQ